MAMRFVDEGTLSVANGGTAVTGLGTSWATTLARNALIWIGDEPFPVVVASRRQRVTDTDPESEPAGTFIEDDTFQIVNPWHGDTILASPGETYFALVPESAADLNEALARFLADLSTFGLIGGAAGDPPAALPEQYVWVNRTTGVITQRQAATDVPILNDNLLNVATRTALKALDTSITTVAILTEAGREGIFNFVTGDLSTFVTADSQEGIYVKADDTVATSGAWVRQHGGIYRPEWFGATAIPDLTVTVSTMPNSTTALAGMAALINFVWVFPVKLSGYYRTTAALAFTCPQLTIEGAGLHEHGFLLDDCNGISLAQTDRQDHCRFAGFGLLFASLTTRKGFILSNTDDTGGNATPRSIERCGMVGLERFLRVVGPVADGPLIGIEATSYERIHVDQCWIEGPAAHWAAGVGGTWPVATIGIQATDTTHLVVTHSFLQSIDQAVRLDGQCEGPHVLDTVIVVCNFGVTMGVITNPSNHLVIRGGHMSCISRSVRVSIGAGITNSMMHIVDGCVMFKRNESTVAGFSHFSGVCAGLLSTNNVFFHSESDDAVADADRTYNFGAGTVKIISANNTYINEGRLVGGTGEYFLSNDHIIDNAKSVLETTPIASGATVTAQGVTGSRSELVNRRAVDGGTTANFSSAAHRLNTHGKLAGTMKLDTTTNLLMIATGATATSPWQPSDGSAVITPV